jgi:hypothetical protein
VSVVDEGGRSGREPLDWRTPVPGHEADARPDQEGLVCLGDEHVKGVESLCVGESQ